MTTAAWLVFAAAAATGAITRYRVGALFPRPWGTFLVNATGSLVAGVLTGLLLYHGLSTATRTVLVTGFCGAYTTFSTFTAETVQLIEEGAVGPAMRNLAATALTCAAAAGAGLALASL